MSGKVPRDQKSTTYRDSPSEQQLAEAIACLVLRTGLTSTTVTAAERQALYEAYPGGFGLVVLAQHDGRVQMTVTEQTARPVLEEMVEKLEQTGGELQTADVPSEYWTDEEARRRGQ